jgi:hypothetical protein
LDIEARNSTSELGMTTRERKQTSLYAGDDFSVKAIKSSKGKPGAGRKKKKSLLNPDLSLESDQEMDSDDSSDGEAYQKKKAALMEPDSSDDEEFTKKPKPKASKPRARKASVGTAGAAKKALAAAGVNASAVSVTGADDTAVVSPAAAGNHPDVIDDKGNNYYGKYSLIHSLWCVSVCACTSLVRFFLSPSHNIFPFSLSSTHRQL